MIVSLYVLNKGEFSVLEEVRAPVVYLFVRASQPVNAFLLDAANLERYRCGQRFEHYGPGTVLYFSAALRVPFIGCHVVLENACDARVEVGADALGIGR